MDDLKIYYVKLCASYQIHRWIQTGVWVRKHSIWVKIGNFLPRVTLKFGMTLENNRAPLLCCFKLCASFQSHWWIQTGVTARKRPSSSQKRYMQHLLKLLDELCRYEMNLVSIVEYSERTRFCPQTDRGTGGLGEPVYPLQLRWAGGITSKNIMCIHHGYNTCWRNTT